ncbi:MAG: hypothetical protein K2J75_04970, partial [Clostridia bacterium]|nr:hypothetical protein [Clostridia bacterium]
YFNTYQDGVIYKIKGRVQYNYFGDASILYVKEVTECDVKGTKLDKRQEKYRAPILLDDDVLGHLILEKSKGLFEGKFNYNEKEINIFNFDITCNLRICIFLCRVL